MMNKSTTPPTDRYAGVTPEQRRWGRIQLMLIVLVFASSAIGAALMYFMGYTPKARTNAGTLISPQRDVPALKLTTLEGQPFELKQLAGKWSMMVVHGGNCQDECAKQLFTVRNLRASVAQEASRVQNIWLITDNEPVPTMVIRAYENVQMLRVDPSSVAALRTWLGTQLGGDQHKGVWLVDQSAHLMMHFGIDKDPLLVRKDMLKLFKGAQYTVRMESEPAQAK